MPNNPEVNSNPADDPCLVFNAGNDEAVGLSIPLDSYATIAALTMAVLRCTDPVRRVKLAEGLLQACRVQAAPGGFITA